jgi:hypothetical protein
LLCGFAVAKLQISLEAIHSANGPWLIKKQQDVANSLTLGCVKSIFGRYSLLPANTVRSTRGAIVTTHCYTARLYCSKIGSYAQWYNKVQLTARTCIAMASGDSAWTWVADGPNSSRNIPYKLQGLHSIQLRLIHFNRTMIYSQLCERDFRLCDSTV